jgi:hypothetical protein
MPTASTRSAATTQARKVQDARHDVTLQVMVPAQVKRAIALRAANEGTTQRTVVLAALRAIGVPVRGDDLRDKRKAR